jgi:RNA polymerase sigma-70 factor (ECF subfamily)
MGQQRRRTEVVPLRFGRPERRAYREREARAFEDHAAMLKRYAELRGAGSDASDVVQEAFIALFAHEAWLAGRLDSPQIVKFLITAVKRRYLMTVRRETRRRDRELRSIRSEPGDGGIWKDRIETIDNAEVAAALQHLRGRQAEAMRLSLSDRNLTNVEIAEVMGISDGSVRSHLKRGKAKLAELLDLGEVNDQ